MRVIFLDFDGVLNQGLGNFDPKCVTALNKITDAAPTRIFISSTWRIRPLPFLRRMFESGGVTGRITGKCPTPSRKGPDGGWAEFAAGMPVVEGEEYPEKAIAIQRTLNLYGNRITNYVILDDIPQGWFTDTPHFFQTDMRVGLTDEMADQILAYFEEQESK